MNFGKNLASRFSVLVRSAAKFSERFHFNLSCMCHVESFLMGMFFRVIVVTC